MTGNVVNTVLSSFFILYWPVLHILIPLMDKDAHSQKTIIENKIVEYLWGLILHQIPKKTPIEISLMWMFLLEASNQQLSLSSLQTNKHALIANQRFYKSVRTCESVCVLLSPLAPHPLWSPWGNSRLMQTHNRLPWRPTSLFKAKAKGRLGEGWRTGWRVGW